MQYDGLWYGEGVVSSDRTWDTKLSGDGCVVEQSNLMGENIVGSRNKGIVNVILKKFNLQ